MFKTKEVAPVTVTDVATVETPITTAPARVVNYDDTALVEAAFNACQNMPIDMMVQETGLYLKFEEGEMALVLCKGLTTMISIQPTNEGEEVEVADLSLPDGTSAINADVVMVSTVKKLIAKGVVPCFLRVGNQGEVKGKAGKYADLKIYRIPMNG